MSNQSSGRRVTRFETQAIARELVFEEFARRLEQGEDSSFGNGDDPSRKRERRPGTVAGTEGTVAEASGSDGGSESGAGEFVPHYASGRHNGVPR